MPKGPEMYHTQFRNPDTVRQDIQINPDTKEVKKGGKKSAKGLRAYGTFNVVTGLAWGTAAVVTGGAAIPVVMASVDGAQAVASFAGANAIDKKGQIEAKNGKYMSAESVRQKRVSKRDLEEGKSVRALTVQDLEEQKA